jgi:hypothetical protein
MAKIPDDITLAQLCHEAAQALARAGMEHRIDIYREVEIDDPAVRMMLGRPHRVRVRIKITAASLLFDDSAPDTSGATSSLGPDTDPRVVDEIAALKLPQRA